MQTSDQLAKIAAIHRQASQIKRYSDRLFGIGPFGVGLDGLLAWVPVAGTVYSAGAGGWLVVQAARAGASPVTIARMLAYIGFNTATSAVPVVGQSVDFLFPGHLMAANALIKDIEARYPQLKPVGRAAGRSWAFRRPAASSTAAS